jgi:hypothetical protein
MATPSHRPTSDRPTKLGRQVNRSKRQMLRKCLKGWLIRSKTDGGCSGVLLVGDTGFEPVTSSVSVISFAHDDAAARVSDVRGCTQMIAGRRTD